MSMQKAKMRAQFDLTNGFETMQKAWSNIEEVPYCF